MLITGITFLSYFMHVNSDTYGVERAYKED